MSDDLAPSAPATSATDTNGTETGGRPIVRKLWSGLFWALVVTLVVIASWANWDLAERRAYLFMDEMIAYDGVAQILRPESPAKFWWAITDGTDQRYGRIFFNATALVAAIPEKLAGDPGMIVGMREAQVLFLTAAYVLLIFTFIRSGHGRCLAFVILACLPFTSYYLTQPKPEPLQLFFLALYLSRGVKTRWGFGWHWIFLGLAFGAKISAAPFCAAAAVLACASAIVERASIRLLLISGVKTVVSFLAGWITAVPTLAVPTWAHIDQYLHWTFRQTAHPFDNASITIGTWMRSLLGTDGIGYLLPGSYALAALIAAGILISFGVWMTLLSPGTWREKWFSQSGWFVLGLSAILIVPIMLTVKRLWGFYLHPGEVLGTIALVWIGERIWMVRYDVTFSRLVARGVVVLIAATSLVVVGKAATKLTADYTRLAHRTKEGDHQRKAAIFAAINTSLLELALAKEKAAQGSGPLRVYYDPFLYLPDTNRQIHIEPYWGAFKFWSHQFDVVVMGWPEQIGYFVDDGLPMFPPTSSRFADFNAARDEFRKMVDLDTAQPASRPYRLIRWINRDAAILVRSDLADIWQVAVTSSANSPGSP